MRHRLYKRV